MLRRLATADANKSVTSTAGGDDTAVAVAAAELRFAEVVLSKYPKAQACWAHRRWVLTRVLGVGSGGGGGGRAAALFAEEARVVERAAIQKRLNYAAWAHRRWCARGTGSENKSSIKKTSEKRSSEQREVFEGLLSPPEVAAELVWPVRCCWPRYQRIVTNRFLS